MNVEVVSWLHHPSAWELTALVLMYTWLVVIFTVHTRLFFVITSDNSVYFQIIGRFPDGIDLEPYKTMAIVLTLRSAPWVLHFG